MQSIDIGGKRVHIFAPQGAVCLKLWAHMQRDEAAALFDAVGEGVALFAADDYDWNADLSPWPAKACFKGSEDFSGNAPARLKWLEQAVVAVEAELTGAENVPRAILGYSLAGLFALWALMESDLFDAAASVSGSLWFDGLLERMQERAGRFAGKVVYLSLGDREARTRNARLASIQDKTAAARDLLSGAGAYTVFELNPGNHFQDPTGRCARAVKWLGENAFCQGGIPTKGAPPLWIPCQGE